MTTTVLPPGSGSVRAGFAIRAARLAVLVLIGLVLLAAVAGGVALLLAGLLVAAGISVLLWRYPAWGAVVLIALLPVNRFLILVVFHYSGSPMATMAAQLWKDLFIAVLAVRALHELLVVGNRPRLRYLDLLVVTFLAIATLYLAYPGPGLHLTFLNRVVGYRADAVFLLAYVVGRVIPFDRRQLRWLLAALVPGVLVVAAVAAGQVARPDWFTQMFNKLGFAEFTGGRLGEVEVVRDRGINGVTLPRASSLLLGDLALGFFSVFAAAVCAALFLTARKAWSAVVAAIGTLASVATAVLTVTRSAVVAAVVVVVLAAFLSRSLARSLFLGLVCALAAALALVVNVFPAEDLSALMDPQESSTQAHIRAIEAGLASVQEYPMGRGLGTAGTIGQRFIPERSLTPENWYLQIATELGLVSGLLFVAISLIGGGIAFAAYTRLHDVELRRIALVTATGSVGFVLLASVLHAWEVPVLAMSFWLLVGITASGVERERELA